MKLTSGRGSFQYRSVSAAGSYASANDRRLLFGLGEERTIRQIGIRWPSGTEQLIDSPLPDQSLRITEPAPSPPSGSRGPAAAVSFFSGSHQGAILRSSYRSVQLVEKTTAEREYESGLALLRQGKINEAAEACRAALRLRHDFVEATMPWEWP